MTDKSRKIIIRTFKEEETAKRFLAHLQGRRESPEPEGYCVLRQRTQCFW